MWLIHVPFLKKKKWLLSKIYGVFLYQNFEILHFITLNYIFDYTLHHKLF